MRKEKIFWIGLAVVFLGLFFYRTVYQSYQFYAAAEDYRWDVDFWLAAGKAWGEGNSPYDPDIFSREVADQRGYEDSTEVPACSYPPHLMPFFMFLRLFSDQTASWIMFGLNLVLTFLLLYLAGRVIAHFRPVGWPEVALLTAMLSTGIRTNLKFGQVGLIIGVGLMAALLFYLTERDVLSGAALGLIAFKPTSFPLLFGFFLLRKRSRIINSALVVIAVFGLLPFMFTDLPVIGTAIEYLSVGRGQAVGIDDPSPFIPSSAMMYHLAILVYRIVNTHTGIGPLISWVVIAALLGLAIWLMMKGKPVPNQRLYDFALFSTLTMLYIYHRSYEFYLLFPAVLYLYLLAENLGNKRGRLITKLAAWGILLADAVPSDISIRAIDYLPALEQSYLFRVAAPVKVWLSLAVLIGLMLFRLLKKGSGRGVALSSVGSSE